MRTLTVSISVPGSAAAGQLASVSLSVPRGRALVEVIAILAIFLATNVLSAQFQRPVAGNGLIWDAVQYNAMAAQIATKAHVVASGNYVYRVGTPFLAALVSSHDLVLGFRIVNTLANFLTTVLLAVWLSLFIRSRLVRVAAVACFVTVYLGSIRWMYYYPIFADHWSFVFVLANLILMRKAEEGWTPRLIIVASVLVFTGVLFREWVLSIGFAWIFVNNPVRYENGSYSARLPHPWLFLPIASGILAFTWVHLIVTPNDNNSFSKAAVEIVLSLSSVRYIHGWFNAYGPVLAFAFFGLRGNLRLLGRHQYLLVFLILILVLVDTGGINTEKYAQWAMPVIYLFIARTMEDNAAAFSHPLFLAAIAALQAFAERVIWVLPDHTVQGQVTTVLLTPMGNPSYLQLWAAYTDPGIIIPEFLQYVALFAFLVVSMGLVTGKLRISPRPLPVGQVAG